MNRPRSRGLPFELPPLSKKARRSDDVLRVSAIEGRSFAYGLMLGYQMPLARLEARFPSAGAHMKGDAGASSRIIYKWARGEAAPRWKKVSTPTGQRSLIDVVGDDLPDVRSRVQHIVWAAADREATLHEDDAVIARGVLPEAMRKLFFGGVLPVSRLTSEAVATALDLCNDDLCKANLIAAFLLWARSPFVHAMRSTSFEGLARIERSMAQARPIIESFIQSSWIYPADRDVVLRHLIHSMEQPFLFDRNNLDPLGSNPGFTMLQASAYIQRLNGNPRRRHIPHTWRQSSA